MNGETQRGLDALAHPDEATLIEWRSDAERWRREWVEQSGSGIIQLAAQRLATLIALVQEQRTEVGRVTFMANDALSELDALDDRAETLNAQLESINVSLAELRALVLKRRPNGKESNDG